MYLYSLMPKVIKYMTVFSEQAPDMPVSAYIEINIM